MAHRRIDDFQGRLDDVFRYESEFPADDDCVLTVIVRIKDEPEWWKSDDVSRVTTSEAL